MNNNEIVKIGVALKWRSTYDAEKTYYQDNIVSLGGSVFRCAVTSVTGKPPINVADADGHMSFANTDTWDVVVDMVQYYNWALDSNNLAKETKEYVAEAVRLAQDCKTLSEQAASTATTAVDKADTAIGLANEAVEKANEAATKCETATENANDATEKALDAVESVDKHLDEWINREVLSNAEIDEICDGTSDINCAFFTDENGEAQMMYYTDEEGELQKVYLAF